MQINRKQVVVLVFLALAVGILLGSVKSAPQAQANALSDFWNNLFTPSSGVTGTPSNPVNSPNSAPYQPANSHEQAVIDAVRRASPAVVSIIISKNVPILEQCRVNPFGNLPPEFQQFFGNDSQGFTQPCPSGKTHLQEVGGGSGFIISADGLILTNKHVISDANASYTVITNDGKKYNAKVLARDPNQDLAVIKIDATQLPVVTLGNSDNLALGQTAIAIGNALGEFTNTVSVGVVSGLLRTVTASGPMGAGQETIQGVIQTDAAINPGNSGGPLLNLRGEVIGINTAVAASAQGIGFAIPINKAKADINSVRTTGEIRTPYLGVRYTIITPAAARDKNLSVDYGVLVQGATSTPAVQPNSPAAKAGIQAGDIILSVDGQKLDQAHSLADIVSQHNVGDTLSLTILRNGKQITVPVTLERRPAGQ
jgi:S1-C subfamily serine protease